MMHCTISLVAAAAVILTVIFTEEIECVDFPDNFYGAKPKKLKNLVDSSRLRPNEPVKLKSPFPFLGNHYCDGSEFESLPEACDGVEGKVLFDTVWVNKNGIISLGGEWRESFVNSFPRLGSLMAIAPLWALLTFGNHGGVFYREGTNRALREYISEEVTDSFSCIDEFKPTAVLEVTWYKMPYDAQCETGLGIGWCTCMVEFDEETCKCKELPMEEYCACVSDSPPEDCTCNTVVEEYSDHCACLENHSSEYCVCLHIDQMTQQYCDCIEEGEDIDVCYCVEQRRGDKEYCQCLKETGYDNYECDLRRDGYEKREAPERPVMVEAEPQRRKKRDESDTGTNEDEQGNDDDPNQYHNTFQALLATDGAKSFVIFNYHSIDLPTEYWTNAHKGVVGFNGGRMDYPYGPYFNHQYSQSVEIHRLISDSNMGVPGRWIYRVDGETVTQPSDC